MFQSGRNRKWRLKRAKDNWWRNCPNLTIWFGEAWFTAPGNVAKKTVPAPLAVRGTLSVCCPPQRLTPATKWLMSAKGMRRKFPLGWLRTSVPGKSLRNSAVSMWPVWDHQKQKINKLKITGGVSWNYGMHPILWWRPYGSLSTHSDISLVSHRCGRLLYQNWPSEYKQFRQSA